MKKIAPISALLTVLAALAYLACTKTDIQKPGPDDLALATANKLDISINRTVLQNDEQSRAISPCGTSGTVGMTVNWSPATCRSDCSHGIGLRCGGEITYTCDNGSTITVQSMGSCPAASSKVKDMTAVFEFYDNNTVKLLFSKSMIPREAGNTTFEVEDNEALDLPSFIAIGGTSYDWVKFIPGKYHINYSDGKFGSVILSVEYV